MIKNIWPILLFLICFCSHGISRADPTVDDNGRFVASFPGSVTRDGEDVDTADGKTKMCRAICSTDSGCFIVSYNDFAPTAPNQINAAEVYKAAIQQSVNSLKITERSEKPYKLGDIEGVEFIGDIPASKAVVRSRLFLVGDRFFSVMYIGLAGSEDTKGALDFLNSFRLLH